MKKVSLARWWREPLLHFVLIGAVLFAVFQWRDGGASRQGRIVITPGQIDTLAAGFTRTWQRVPSERELKAQLDEFVREEIAAREATAMGLDRDDVVVRRRLRQKFEFLAEDAIDAAPPTDAQLQAWFDTRAVQFQGEARISMRQVLLSRERRGDAIDRDARQLLARLSTTGPDADIGALSDSRMLPDALSRSTPHELARIFGDGFAAGLVSMPVGRWSGPVASTYGLHIVLVREREEATTPTLADVRPLVEREFVAQRRREQIDAMYARLLQHYRVVVEQRAPPPASVAAGPR
ncbi:MAG TPA: peptidylprolyl isomerase [Burkholderiaceae bacterium]|nr:peptidylprolyl isomerase [Burkholderiaceae bacterium]